MRLLYEEVSVSDNSKCLARDDPACAADAALKRVGVAARLAGGGQGAGSPGRRHIHLSCDRHDLAPTKGHEAQLEGLESL